MTLWVGAQLGKLPSCQGTSSLMIRVYPLMHKVQNGQTHKILQQMLQVFKSMSGQFCLLSITGLKTEKVFNYPETFRDLLIIYGRGFWRK